MLINFINFIKLLDDSILANLGAARRRDGARMERIRKLGTNDIDNDDNTETRRNRIEEQTLRDPISANHSKKKKIEHRNASDRLFVVVVVVAAACLALASSLVKG